VRPRTAAGRGRRSVVPPRWSGSGRPAPGLRLARRPGDRMSPPSRQGRQRADSRSGRERREGGGPPRGRDRVSGRRASSSDIDGCWGWRRRREPCTRVVGVGSRGGGVFPAPCAEGDPAAPAGAGGTAGMPVPARGGTRSRREDPAAVCRGFPTRGGDGRGGFRPAPQRPRRRARPPSSASPTANPSRARATATPACTCPPAGRGKRDGGNDAPLSAAGAERGARRRTDAGRRSRLRPGTSPGSAPATGGAGAGAPSP
jgi:hypothetical protein